MQEAEFAWQELRKFLVPDLDTIIHYVTSRCNAACAHCFFASRLNQKNDLTREENLRVVEGVRNARGLLIAGGEPFLSKDLADIVIAYAERAGVKFAQIPTMGLHGVRMEAVISRILDRCPGLCLTIQVSLDGFADFHDENRQVQGLFSKAIENLKAAIALKDRYPTLRITVCSVLMKENLDSIGKLALFIRDEIRPDGHSLELVRGRDDGLRAPEVRRRVEEVVAFWRELLGHYYRKEPGKAQSRKNIYFSRPFRGLLLRFARRNLETSLRNFLDEKPWAAPCVAGKRIAVLYPEGDLAACELRGRVSNIRDHGFDLGRALRSREFVNEVKSIREDQCFCTHGCFIPPSARYSPSSLVRLALGIPI